MCFRAAQQHSPYTAWPPADVSPRRPMSLPAAALNAPSLPFLAHPQRCCLSVAIRFELPRAVVIDALYDDLDDLEDELELAAEEAYLTEAALEEADGAGDAGSGQTMADLEKSK